eukprot:scaffold2011_cov142-Skeletonema_menzelii.AAC.10
MCALNQRSQRGVATPQSSVHLRRTSKRLKVCVSIWGTYRRSSTSITSCRDRNEDKLTGKRRKKKEARD